MPRDTRLSIAVPADFWLPGAVCSYGYFLLAPNRWNPRGFVLERAFDAAEFGLPTEPFGAQISQSSGRGGPLRVACDRPITPPAGRALRVAVGRMLRIDDDLTAWRRAHPEARRRGFGRLFRSATFFEDVVKTVTSCNVGWPSTVRMNALLVERVGGGAFPTPRALAAWSPARLKKACKVGYRADRLIRVARAFARGELEASWFESPDRTPDELRTRLLEVYGIGPYAAANLLQLLGRLDDIPIDTETYRLFVKRTGAARPRDPKRLDAAILAHYEPYRPHRFLAYWFDLWRDYESQRGDAWTWDPATVGSSFTASKLD